jgi:hypothetical protein
MAKKIERITIDIDSKNFFNLLKSLIVLWCYGFRKNIEIRQTRRGYHVIGWHTKRGYYWNKIYKIRKLANDDANRILLDMSSPKRAKQILFRKKTVTYLK